MTMNKTTELQKEIENWRYIEKTMPQEHQKKEFTCSISTLNYIKNQSELRGRLDALKEEVEFLEDNIEDELECNKCKNKLFILRCAEREYCNKCGSMRTFAKLNKIEKRIASIQEEIKLIENSI